MKITTASVLIVICLVCAGPLAKIKAVSPPPDGDYPGGNTAEGQEALFGLPAVDITQPLVDFRLQPSAPAT